MPDLGFLLPPLSAVERGSTVVHIAPIEETPMVVNGEPYTHRYPRLTALCGVRGWGETSGPATCKRCLLASAVERGQ